MKVTSDTPLGTAQILGKHWRVPIVNILFPLQAVWFTEEKGTEGPVFGNVDKWKGLGIIFDSFDNDGQHNNPYIMAMVNDGTKEYDHHR